MLAKPQVEDGYTRIANELLDALCNTKLSDSEHRIMLFVIRHTYGFGRKSKMLSNNYIADGIGLDRRRVIEAIKALKLKNMLLVTKTALVTKNGLVKANEISIQKNYIQWRLVTKTALVEKKPRVVTETGQSSDRNRTFLVTETAPNKEKERKYKERENKKSTSDKNRTRFIPPTLEEVREYCKQRNNGIDAQRFVDFYEATNWYRGKTKIKSWRACVRTWEGNKSNEDNSYEI